MKKTCEEQVNEMGSMMSSFSCALLAFTRFLSQDTCKQMGGVLRQKYAKFMKK